MKMTNQTFGAHKSDFFRYVICNHSIYLLGTNNIFEILHKLLLLDIKVYFFRFLQFYIKPWFVIEMWIYILQ